MSFIRCLRSGPVFVMVLFIAIATACGPIYSENNPDRATLSLVNGSEEDVIFVLGSESQGFEERFEDPILLQSLPPGSTGVSIGYAHVARDTEWCMAQDRVIWVVQDRIDRDLPPTPFDADPANFEIIQKIGPDLCWPERNSEYIFSP